MNSRHFASTISFLFHPMIISFVAFYLLLFGRVPIADNAVNVLIICFIFSNLIPISTVLFLKKTGRISDLDASQKEQRIFPLILGIIYSGIAFLILTYMNADPLVRGLMFCYMIYFGSGDEQLLVTFLIWNIPLSSQTFVKFRFILRCNLST